MTVTAALNAITEVESYGENSSGDQRRFTVAGATDIAKGSNLQLSGDRTASQSTGRADMFAGIAAMDKEGDDPSTEIATWQNGIYEFCASGAIEFGTKVVSAVPKGGYANQVCAATPTEVTSSNSIIIGVAQKTVSDSERVQVRVNN